METLKDTSRRIEELQRIIAAEKISISNGATPQYDDNGQVKVDMATCGTCGLSWNDALITSRTPAPSGRCPYECIHTEIAELKRLQSPGRTKRAKAERTRRQESAVELVTAINDCLADLKHYAATHGPGPDRRLKRLQTAIATFTKLHCAPGRD